MEDRLRKTERLIKLWLILLNNPFLYSTREIARRFDVHVKTVYRDLDSLDVDLRVPITKQGIKWGIDQGYFLPPIRFSVSEGLIIFLAARLMMSYSHRYDPNMDSVFGKLVVAVPQPIRQQVQKTLDWMQRLPVDKMHLRNLARLAEAWVSQHQIKISYRSTSAEKSSERIIDPYFIEPIAMRHASYVIAYCHRAKAIRTFKIERIESIDLLPESYVIPNDFDANAYLGSAWGIVVEDEVKTIRLKFASGLARLIEETVWHPSQRLEKKENGSVIMTLVISDTDELRSWILGWGNRLEVLEPESLRNAIAKTAQDTHDIYVQNRLF